MQTSMACKPCRFLAQLPSDSRRFPPASLRETRETPVHFRAKPRHFPRKPPQFPLKAHAVPPLPSVDLHRNAPRTRAFASSNSATEPTFSAHQRNARDNKPMQLSTTAIPAHEKGAREPLTLYYLVFVFTVCSILGLILETIVSYFVDGRWESRVGFIWGPFSPIYGVGGVLITLALHRFENASPLVIYAVSAAFGAAFEYFAAWFWESAFGIVAWSYINQPFNIGGKTCLGIALVWGLAGLAWVKLAAPVLKETSKAVPRAWREPLAWALLIFFLVDAATTMLALDCWMYRLNGLEPEGALQQFFAQHYGDGAMQAKFETMSIYPQLATLRG